MNEKPKTLRPSNAEMAEMLKEKKINFTVEQLLETLETREQAFFFALWLKNNRNATRAYKEFNPNVKNDRVAGVRGHEMLSRIPKKLILRSFMDSVGLNEKLYFDKLVEAVQSKQLVNPITQQLEPNFAVVKPYHDKLGKLLEIETDEKPKAQTTFQIQVISYDDNLPKAKVIELEPLDEKTEDNLEGPKSQ